MKLSKHEIRVLFIHRERFSFYVFFGSYNFHSRVLLDLFANFILDLLILDVTNLLLMFHFDSWYFERVFLR